MPSTADETRAPSTSNGASSSTDDLQHRGGRVPAPDGSERVSANGYAYTKSGGKWRLTHHIIAEEKILGRPLRVGERVEFRDKNRENLDPNNIIVRPKGEGSVERRLAVVEDRIRELEAERELLLEEIESKKVKKA